MSSSSSATIAKGLQQPTVEVSSTLFRSSTRQTLLSCLLLTAAVLAFYSPVTHNGFLNYDDNGYITANPHVRAGLTWGTVKWAFTTYEQGNWHPLTWLSHALDCELFGLNPAGHHYTNVLLHAVNAVLLFLLLQSATGYRWRSVLVAALFALHPMNVESVAWAAERKNVLSMMFFLLALYAYVRYAQKPGVRRYAAVAFFFVLALLSKPQVITFPFLLLLFDFWPLGRTGSVVVSDPTARGKNAPALSSRRLVLEKVPLLMLSAASALVTMSAQRAGLAVQTFSQYSLLLRIETAAISYVSYLEKMFWPSKMVALYPHPTKLYPPWQAVAALVLLLLITGLVFRARHRGYLVVGWLWFLGSLVPMIGLVQVGVQTMADRYAYIPFIGLFLMIIWLAADWTRSHQTFAKPVAILAICWLLGLGILTYRQVSYWHDSESFWLRTLSLTHDNYVAETNLGDFLLSQDRSDEAAAHFRAALSIRPDGLTANLNLGAYEDRRGNLTAAIERYEIVADHAADLGMRATAYSSMGFAYRGMRQPVKAKECFEAALRVAPDWTRAMIGLGLIAQENGNMPEAVRQYTHAVALKPSDVGYLLLAQALQQEGRADEANAIYQSVAQSPNLRVAQKAAESLLSGK